ncbi:hypothetical protein FQA39_LY16220 [Lamprigera yunnana]|nr:hypothetical protein FQA39_LY16220 [Lamprigera yunnana]
MILTEIFYGIGQLRAWTVLTLTIVLDFVTFYSVCKWCLTILSFRVVLSTGVAAFSSESEPEDDDNEALVKFRSASDSS